MSSDTAELAIREGAGELLEGVGFRAERRRGAWRARQALARLRADEARMAALRDSARALIGSRLLVWLAGVGTIAAFGFGPVRNAFDPPGVTKGFGWLGDALAAPAARWDSSWYLVIAHWGYRPDLGSFTAPRAAFFPLYPLGIAAVSSLHVPPVAAGVLVSLIAFAVALYGIHRLTAFELKSPEAARLAVMATAFGPMALFFSAVYSESLFMALSVGMFWSARHGRFAAAGALGMLASATRSTGLMLVVPAVLLYLYGPRADRPVERAGGCALTPRYRVRSDAAWLLLIPAGMGAYMAYLALSGGSVFEPLHAQEVWGRAFAGPFGAVWQGLHAGFEGLRQLLSFQQLHSYWPAAGGNPIVAAWHNVLPAAFLIAAGCGVVGVLRRLPIAYGAYVVAALAMPLSYPAAPQPLMSLPRYMIVLFPLSMWVGSLLEAHPRARLPALALSSAAMVVAVGEFATWHWVA